VQVVNVPEPAAWDALPIGNGTRFVSPQFNVDFNADGTMRSWDLVSRPAPEGYGPGAAAWFQGSSRESQVDRMSQALAWAVQAAQYVGAPQAVVDYLEDESLAFFLFNTQRNLISNVFNALEPRRLVNALVFGTGVSEINSDMENATGQFRDSINERADEEVRNHLQEYWQERFLVEHDSIQTFSLETASVPFVAEPGHRDTMIGSFMGDSFFGGDQDDIAFGWRGADFLDGGPGNDLLAGAADNDTLNGGPGVDTAAFAGPRSAYTITDTGHRSLRVSGPDGTDIVNNVERLIFDGRSIGTGGDSDVLWRHTDGAVVTWEMENGEYVSNHNIAFASVGWEIEGLADFDADGDADILWRHQEGAVVTWEMQGGAFVQSHSIETASAGWRVEGTEDFNSDGTDDILWRHTDGMVVTWDIQDNEFVQTRNFGVIANTWHIRGTGEFDLA
jgi:FG-GAP-like repeat/RTX calcium-binding nonapeptide repeat (4 copies)